MNGHDIDKNVCVFFDKEMRWDGTKIKSGESTNYYTATGKTRFKLTFKENVNGKEKSINVKLDTHSPMGDDNYFEMVEELIAVYDDIVMDSESKSSLSEGNSWSKELDKLSHILKKIKENHRDITRGYQLGICLGELSQNNHSVTQRIQHRICSRSA